MSDFDLRKHFKKQYINESNPLLDKSIGEEYTKYDVIQSLLDLLDEWKDFQHPYYVDVQALIKKYVNLKEGKKFYEDGEETDYVKRRKKEDDYYQDQDSLKEVNDLMEKIGFGGPDYNDELSMTLKAINSNIHSKALSPGEPIVQQIGNKLGDILDLVNALPEKGQPGKIGFRK